MTGNCSGDRCCSYQGINFAGSPICKCTKDLTKCMNCQFNPMSLDSNNICYDPTFTKCTGKNCCQLETVSPIAKICSCKSCGSPFDKCTWSK